MNQIEKEKQLWRDLWEACKEQGGENWNEIRQKMRNVNSGMQEKSKAPLKTISRVKTRVSSLIKYAEENGVVDYVDRENYQIHFPKKDFGKKQVQVLKELPSLKELTQEVLKKNHKKIRILDNWMSYILVDEADLLKIWMKKSDKLEILLLHPESPQIAHRFSVGKASKFKEHQENKKQAIDCLEKLFNIIQFFKKEEGYTCDVQVKLYDENPGIMAFIFDNQVYYGNFLNFSTSYRTFVHKFTRTDAFREIDRQINKHYNKLWDSARECTETMVSNLRTNNESDDQEEYIYRKAMIDDLESKYVLYTPDEAGAKLSKISNHFQRSILTINKQQYTCQVTINQRNNSLEIVSFEGTIRAIGKHNLLFRFRRKNFFLSLLMFTGVAKERNTYQGIYLHSNLANRPTGSYAIFLPFSITEQEDQNPTREDVSIDGNVKRFFALKKNLALSLESGVYYWDQFCIERDINREVLEHLCGSWSLFYPNRYPQSIPREKRKNGIKQDYHIAQSHFEILKNKEEKFICRFSSPPQEKVELVGVPYITEINHKLYLHCTLEKTIAQQTSVFLQLTFLLGKPLKKPQKVNGTYNIIYANGTMGTGLVTMIKEDKPICQLINPFDNTSMENFPSAINHLVSEDISSLLSTGINNQQLNRISTFAGVYKLFVYVRTKIKGDAPLRTRGIAINRLEILKYGQVLFNGVKGITATGRAFIQRNNNLYIDLKNTEVDQQRSGYIILKIRDLKAKPTPIFCGVFVGLGVEEYDVQPLGKRVIVQLMPDTSKNFEVEKIPLHSPKMEKIPKEIRKTLTGRTSNYIGFQRLQRGLFDQEDLKKYNKETANMSEIFSFAAIYKALNTNDIKDIEGILNTLRRAILHGFSEKNIFEEKIKSSSIIEQILENPDYQDLWKLINP